jgi:septin family protein
MRRLSPRVNVIPVIGRADSLTPQELRDFKRRIMEDIEHYNIPIYNFPYDPEEDDEDTVEENSELRVSISQVVWTLMYHKLIINSLVRVRHFSLLLSLAATKKLL